MISEFQTRNANSLDKTRTIFQITFFFFSFTWKDGVDESKTLAWNEESKKKIDEFSRSLSEIFFFFFLF